MQLNFCLIYQITKICAEMCKIYAEKCSASHVQHAFNASL